ncbi:MAG: hypothetical protein V3V99_11245 [candidate division Zixibacteria bacterium]
MTFKKESEMLEPVLSWAHTRGFTTKTEFPTGWGICDVVAASPNKFSIKKRLKYNQKKPILSLQKIDLLYNIPDEENGHSISLKRLGRESKSHYPDIDLDFELTELTRQRYIVSPRAGYYQKRNGWQPLQKKLLAIEIKLNRIEEALFQAFNNLKFASESYVALPKQIASRIAKSKRLVDFVECGVGLISVNQNTCRVLRKSKSNNTILNSKVQMTYIERFWQDWLKDN